MKNKDFFHKYINYTVTEKPTGAVLCITSQCNLKCTHCFNDSGNNTDCISDEKWLALIDDLLDFGVSQINFSGGEPLIKKDLLIQCIEKISAFPKVVIGITTNCCYFNKEFSELLGSIKNQVHMQLSLDGHTTEINHITRNDFAVYDSVINTIKLCESKENMYIQITHIVNKKTVPFINNFLEFISKFKIDMVLIGPVLSIGRAARQNDFTLTDEEGLEIVREVLKLKEIYKNKFSLVAGSPGKLYDLVTYLSTSPDWLVVDFLGNVKLSVKYPYIIDNVFESGVRKSWNSLIVKQKEDYYIEDMIENLLIT